MEVVMPLLLFIVIVVGFIRVMIYFEARKKTTGESPRRHIKDVKPGEYIRIEWHRVIGGIGTPKCLNNDPKTKKILLEQRWNNYKEAKCPEYEKLILDYDSIELKNFHLLNELELPAHPKPQEDPKADFDIATLQKKMNEALDNEEYEKATELQKKIDKLLKK